IRRFMTIEPILMVVCLCGAVLQLAASDSASTAAVPSANQSAAAVDGMPAGVKDGSQKVITSDDLNQLRERIAKQEEEIKRLQQSVGEQRVFLEQAVQGSGSGQTVVSGSTRAGGAPVKFVPAVNVAHPDITGSGRGGQKTVE